MVRVGCTHLLVVSLLFVLNESASIFSGIPILNQIFGNETGIIASALGTVSSMTLQELIGEISPENIADYEAGVRTGDKDLNITELIEKYGYNVETHETETEDGYILTMFKMGSNRNGPSVLLQHGLAGSADEWITPGPNISLAHLLVDKGYEVWLGNARGTKYCLKHVNLTMNDEKFWDFSWDEIGRYDVTALIDYILKVTKKTQLMYVGHSSGTSEFLVMASERPEYNKKVAYAALLAVTAWIYHTTSSIVQSLSPYTQEYNFFVRTVFGRDPEVNGTLSYKMKAAVCFGGLLQNLFCYNAASVVGGIDNKQINFKALPSIMTHARNGFSFKEVQHFSQLVVSKKFRRYDYKKNKNIRIYGSETPPDYQVHKITTPLGIFHAKNDKIIRRPDVNILISKLTTNVTLHVIPYEKFSHFDFLLAKDARTLLYNDVVDIMDGHKPE